MRNQQLNAWDLSADNPGALITGSPDGTFSLQHQFAPDAGTGVGAMSGTSMGLDHDGVMKTLGGFPGWGTAAGVGGLAAGAAGAMGTATGSGMLTGGSAEQAPNSAGVPEMKDWGNIGVGEMATAGPAGAVGSGEMATAPNIGVGEMAQLGAGVAGAYLGGGTAPQVVKNPGVAPPFALPPPGGWGNARFRKM